MQLSFSGQCQAAILFRIGGTDMENVQHMCAQPDNRHNPLTMLLALVSYQLWYLEQWPNWCVPDLLSLYRTCLENPFSWLQYFGKQHILPSIGHLWQASLIAPPPHAPCNYELVQISNGA